ELRWSFQSGGWILGRPAVTDRHVVIGSQDKQMYCLEKQTGKVIWKLGTGSRVETGASIHNGIVYFCSCDGNLYSVEIHTGKSLWKFSADPRREDRPSPIYSVPIITDEAVYFAAGEGQVYSVDRATGKLLWKIRPSESSELFSSLATDGRRLFVTSRPKIRDVEGEHGIFAIGETNDR
ncbi:MAG: PQQ-like beta-propeller repeat protein, partial [Planctomycetes bacterium]|nr:PQQ-like beta-propeller repeat protein [Planctomycetota bacterium]